MKLKEYALTQLMKQVRKTVKNIDEDTTGNSAKVKESTLLEGGFEKPLKGARLMSRNQ